MPENLHPPVGRDLLVIGYGNTLRGDDGVGPRVADAVEALQMPGVRALACPQLTPEIADPIAQARAVIFVDAAVEAGTEVRLHRLEPHASSQVMAHAAEPRTLLALARDVFGHAPTAWCLTIPAADLGFGEDLSPAARQGMQTALQEIRTLRGQIDAQSERGLQAAGTGQCGGACEIPNDLPV